MRAAFLVPTLQRSGGIQAVVGQVRLLRARSDIDAAIVVCGSEGADAGGSASADVPVIGFTDASSPEWDVAVATWWTTWAAALELSARRRVLLLQGLDERFYRRSEPFERLGAAAALASADEIIAVSKHLAAVTAALRPDAPCRVVRMGLDRAVFADAGREDRSGALRVLVEGNPGLWLKGVDDALAAVRAMDQPVHSTLVTLDREAAGDVGVDRVVGDLDPAAMADLYRESDVLLKLSRTEGLGLPPLEAAAVGTPSVVTPYGGHADWLEHGVNGVQVGFDDPAAAAAWLDLLARERPMLRTLGEGASATARGWPSVEESADAMADALREIAVAGPPDLDDVRRSAARALERGLALGRVTQAGHYDAIGTLDRERALMEAASQAVIADRLRADEQLQAILESRAYRLTVSLRNLWQFVRSPLLSVTRGWRRR